MHQGIGFSRRAFVVCAGLASVATMASSSAAQSTFTFTSTPGSWVGHGYLDYSIAQGVDGWNFSGTASADHRYVYLSASRTTGGTSNYYWILQLESSDASPLTPGVTYTGATRYPFNDPGEPGLTLSGNHRGNNENAGYFTVHLAEFGSGTTLTRFSVDFRQYDEGNLNNWVDGQFRFNVPEPATLVGLAGVGMVASARRRRSA